MIVGRGLLGSNLYSIDNSQFVFYANGISNSVLSEIHENNSEFNEIKEISRKGCDACFVYFSTCQVNSACNYQRPYVKHKILIEEYIKQYFESYLIIRTSNLVGNNPWNSHTLFNYLYYSLTANEQITINPVLCRNFLDVAHFVRLVGLYVESYKKNETIEIVNPDSYRMKTIVNEFEKYFSKKFNMNEVKQTNNFAIFDLNTHLSIDLFAQCNISTKSYIPSLLKKYYPVLSFQKCKK